METEQNVREAEESGDVGRTNQFNQTFTCLSKQPPASPSYSTPTACHHKGQCPHSAPFLLPQSCSYTRRRCGSMPSCLCYTGHLKILSAPLLGDQMAGIPPAGLTGRPHYVRLKGSSSDTGDSSLSTPQSGHCNRAGGRTRSPPELPPSGPVQAHHQAVVHVQCLL